MYTRTIYSKMKSVSHHSVDLLYKSTVHNSFVSYCLLNTTWNSAFIAPNQKNITRKFIPLITSKLFPNIMKVANCRNHILKPGLSILQVKFLKTSYLQVFVHWEILLNNLHCQQQSRLSLAK